MPTVEVLPFSDFYCFWCHDAINPHAGNWG